MRRFGFSAALILGITACSQPVVRHGNETTPLSESKVTGTGKLIEADTASTAIPNELRKRIWVLPFNKSPAEHPAFAGLDSVHLLQNKMAERLTGDRSPFVAQSLAVGVDLEALKVDSSMDTAEVARIARGEGMAGFLRGEMTQLNIIEQTSPEGLLKSRTMTITMEVSYELFDANSAHRIAAGFDSESAIEKRTDIFGAGTDLRNPSDRVNDLAKTLSDRMIARLAPFASKLGWSGRILKTEGSRIYLNSGRRTGLQVGDVLKVIESPRDIFDPQSGKFVGQAPGRVKGTLKLIQYFGIDGAVAVLQSGGGILPGDRVELY